MDTLKKQYQGLVAQEVVFHKHSFKPSAQLQNKTIILLILSPHLPVKRNRMISIIFNIKYMFQDFMVILKRLSDVRLSVCRYQWAKVRTKDISVTLQRLTFSKQGHNTVEGFKIKFIHLYISCLTTTILNILIQSRY